VKAEAIRQMILSWKSALRDSHRAQGKGILVGR